MTDGPDRGALYAVVGEKYLREALTSVRSLRAVHPDLPIDILTTEPAESFEAVFGGIPGVHRRECRAEMTALGIDMSGNHEVSRALKVSTVTLSRFATTLFLDSDTFIRQPVTAIFEALETGPEPPALVVTNEPEARHVTHPGASRPVAETLTALSSPKVFNSGVFAFSDRLRAAGFGTAWQETWLAQIRAAATTHDWGRLSDQRALNATIRRQDPPRTVFSNTVWNAQCKILGALIDRGLWDDIRIVHCKLVHSHGSDPEILRRLPYVKRFTEVPPSRIDT